MKTYKSIFIDIAKSHYEIIWEISKWRKNSVYPAFFYKVNTLQ